MHLKWIGTVWTLWFGPTPFFAMSEQCCSKIQLHSILKETKFSAGQQYVRTTLLKTRNTRCSSKRWNSSILILVKTSIIKISSFEIFGIPLECLVCSFYCRTGWQHPRPSPKQWLAAQLSAACASPLQQKRRVSAESLARARRPHFDLSVQRFGFGQSKNLSLRIEISFWFMVIL